MSLMATSVMTLTDFQIYDPWVLVYPLGLTIVVFLCGYIVASVQKDCSYSY